MKAFAPNGQEIVATWDLIPGAAGILEFDGRNEDGTLDFENDGETDVFWDGQYQTSDATGDAIYLDEQGNEWPERCISLEGEPLKEDTRTLRKFTAFCRESNGLGTMYITTVKAHSADQASAEALEECVGAWDYDIERISVIGIIEGDVKIIEWNDDI